MREMDTSTLTQENLQLKAHIRDLTNDARHNEQVMLRIQQHELLLLSSNNLPQLLAHLTTDTTLYFSLKTTRLVLLDPESRTRSLLNTIGIQHISEDIEFTHQLPEYCMALEQPMMCDKEHHLVSTIFNAKCNIQSCTIIPLLRGPTIIGCLIMGSTDATRFTQGLAADFLLRLGYIAAVCVENATNHLQLLISGMTDPLTGIYNRRLLDKRLPEEIALAIRHGSDLSCLFIDADHFKNINDTYGHAIGDQVLKSLAKNISSLLRNHDIAVRFGGEEFALLLPKTNLKEAVLLADRLLRKISSTEIRTDLHTIQISVSIGVSYLPHNTELTQKQLGNRLIIEADKAVYRAKEAGRNCVRYQPEPPSP